jgi:hypothetical protein
VTKPIAALNCFLVRDYVTAAWNMRAIPIVCEMALTNTEFGPGFDLASGIDCGGREHRHSILDNGNN